MMMENQSTVFEFLLLGLPIRPGQQNVFFILFLAMYLTTVLGNMLIILLISVDSHLHTPMYFFLRHLALTDISFSSITAPKLLVNMLTHSQSISYTGCISQVYFFSVFGSIDSFLLTSMAYDRYVAICHPLHYITVMREEFCVRLVIGSWIVCCIHSLLHTLLLIQLSFCASNTVPNFFCDITALLKLSCSDISLNKLVMFIEGGLLFFLSLSIIISSYILIGSTALKTPSTKRFIKTFSTCGSHLLVVFLFYGTVAGEYFFSSFQNSSEKDIVASIIYAVITPLLNPFIYSLKNRDIKQALEVVFSRINCFK